MLTPSNPSLGALYLTLGEACHACGLKPHVVRYWESQIPALKPAKHRGTRRLYSPQEVNTLLRVKQWLLEQSYSFKQVNALLPTPAATAPAQPLAPLIKELQEVIFLLNSE